MCCVGKYKESLGGGVSRVPLAVDAERNPLTTEPSTNKKCWDSILAFDFVVCICSAVHALVGNHSSTLQQLLQSYEKRLGSTTTKMVTKSLRFVINGMFLVKLTHFSSLVVEMDKSGKCLKVKFRMENFERLVRYNWDLKGYWCLGESYLGKMAESKKTEF